MKTTQVKIGGRVFALAFNVNVMETLDDMIENFDMAHLTDYVKKPGGMKDVLTAMAKEGESMEGRALDVDRDWFGRKIGGSSKNIAMVQIAIFNAMKDGMFMQTEDDDGGEVDVVLEEIKKKEMKGG